jgi:DNA end-binding protein Ku
LPERETGEKPSAPLGRSLWSGSISFGLVTVPVELYSASRGAPAALRMLSPERRPLARQYVCPREDEAVPGDELERGYEVREGEFVVVTDEELEALAPRRSREISLERFVPRQDVDPAYCVRSYFMIPGAEQTKAYRLLAETMEASERAGIAEFVMRGKSYAVAIFAERGILRAETLRFGDEVRTPQDLGLPAPGKVGAAKRKAMAKRVSELAAPALDEKELRDEEAERLLALARRKRERGEDVVEAPEEAPPDDDEEGGELVDLMALLRQRMRERRTGESRDAKPERARKKAAPKRRGARRPRRRGGASRS